MIKVAQTDQGITMTLASPESVSDEELMRRVATGEQGALGQLYGRHYPLLRKIVSGKVSNFCDIEEVLQDVFVAVWNCACSYDPAHGKPLGWVICMAHRRAIDHLRRNRRHQATHVQWSGCTDEIEAEENPSFFPLPTQDHPGAARDLRECLTDLIAQLPAAQQHVLELAYFGDLSQRQISARTGIPLGIIKTRLELAINKLAKKSEHLWEDL